MDQTNPKYPIDGGKAALWMATAPQLIEIPEVSESVHVDVAIVGGGLTGLRAALALREAGASVLVLEAKHIGFGASGRSGGQVNLGLNTLPSALKERFGSAGERMLDTVIGAPDALFETVRRYQLKCDAVQNGWVIGAAHASAMEQQVAMARDYEALGLIGGSPFEVLDAAALHKRSGAQGYVGGLFCAKGGSVQPLSYTREMARAVIQRGGMIAEQSPVSKLERVGGQWQVSAGESQVTADKVLLCTNGYTDDLWSGLKQTLVPVRSLLVATEPLREAMRAEILPGEVTFVDKRRLILYLRYDRDGRLCIGDRGPTRDAFRESDFDFVKARTHKLFPQLEGVGFDYAWGGRVAITKDGLPFLSQPAPGLWVGTGYNGRGVAMGSKMGEVLAEAALGTHEDELGFPVTTPGRFAFHRFYPMGVRARTLWAQWRDRVEGGD